MSRLEIRGILFHCVALSLTIALSPISYALSPINSTQDGQIIQGGTFYNTPNSQTTFINSHSGDLRLPSGTTLRGLEVNPTGNLTNNGGTIQLYAPHNVVQVYGDIDVSGIVNGQGAYLGNGGKVLVNADYLYQGGNITALGVQGGHVNMNVNSLTIAPQVKIDASGGPGGIGGTIRINASGVVDIWPGAMLSTTGVPFPKVDSNVIEITGRVVNNEGLLNANGISTNFGQNMNASNGGTIRLVANNGTPNLQPVAKGLSESTVFSPTQSQAIISRLQGLAHTYANKIINAGSITANGGSVDNTSTPQGGNGGIIQLTASRGILNQSTGIISANGGSNSVIGSSTNLTNLIGGRGGRIELSTIIPWEKSQNDGLIQANGGEALTSNVTPHSTGGDGGTLMLRNFINTGSMEANGGRASSYSFSQGGLGGKINAVNLVNTNTGSVAATGGGTSGHDTAHGGVGGTVTMTNLTNHGTITVDGGGGGSIGGTGSIGGLFQGVNILNTGSISAAGGAGGGNVATGATGGRIQITNLTNTGLIAANGGLGYNGGNGGFMNFNKVNNSGLIEANGGNTTLSFGSISGPAGNGGTIIGTHTTNTGTVEALGGTRADGGPNGNDGTVIGF